MTRGRKFASYPQVASRKEDVLVSQEEPLVERFLRMGNGSWNLIGVSDESWRIPLAAVYRRVRFE